VFSVPLYGQSDLDSKDFKKMGYCCHLRGINNFPKCNVSFNFCTSMIGYRKKVGTVE
jgi:hypothetical protein